MDIYATNSDLIQTLVGIFGLGVGAIVWAIFYCR